MTPKEWRADAPVVNKAEVLNVERDGREVPEGSTVGVDGSSVEAHKSWERRRSSTQRLHARADLLEPSSVLRVLHR